MKTTQGGKGDFRTKDFEKVDEIGSAEFYISEDTQYFKKKMPGKEELVAKEFSNLKDVYGEDIADGLKFVEPIAVSGDCLITRYVNATNLVNDPSPRLYEEFGATLRQFHNSGYTHGHLQFNDVLYDGDVFYLTDLTLLREERPIQDLVVPKVGLQAFKIKRPWWWRKYDRCYRAFLRGYGHEGETDDEFLDSYDEFLSKRIDGYKSKNFLSWKYHVLRTCRRLRMI